MTRPKMIHETRAIRTSAWAFLIFSTGLEQLSRIIRNERVNPEQVSALNPLCVIDRPDNNGQIVLPCFVDHLWSRQQAVQKNFVGATMDGRLNNGFAAQCPS